MIKIQTALAKLKLLPASGATGTYDNETKAAVEKFQSLKKLSVDGCFNTGTCWVELAADGPPVLHIGGTAYYLPWLDLLKVADFLRLDIPLPHPPEGTAVAP